ncbi:MAG: hypothetical protein Roseis2KO_45320 [Roseivirga sp.]
MRNIVFILLVSALCLACDGVQTSFEQPQPGEAENLNRIPAQLRGKYFDEEDSVFLYISRNSIIKEGTYAFRELLDSMESETKQLQFKAEQRKDTTIIIKEDGFEIRAQVEGDSIFVNVSGQKTLFEISDSQFLRRAGKQYFINTPRSGSNNWEVQTMSLENGILSITSLPDKVNIDSLKTITKVETLLDDDGEVDAYKLDPTLKELLAIVKLSEAKATRYRKIK